MICYVAAACSKKFPIKRTALWDLKNKLFPTNVFSVRVYAVIISKYATKIVGTQKRQEACVHGTQDQKQSTFNTFKPAQ